MTRDLGEKRRDRWSGVEVEGRLSGWRTLFLKVPQESATELMRSVGAVHLYLTREAWGPGEVGMGAVDEALADGRTVTLEVPAGRLGEVPSRLRASHQVRLQLALDVGQSALDEIRELSALDEVRLDGDLFHTASFSAYKGSHTAPKDYEEDEPK